MSNFYQKRADALAEQIQALKTEAEGYATRAEAEERDITAEERADADAKLAEAIALKAEYADATTRAAELADLEDVVVRGGETVMESPTPRDVPNINTRTDVYDFSDLPSDEHARRQDLNARAFSMIEKSRAFHEDDHKESATRVLEQTSGTAARQTILSEHPDYVRGYAKYMCGQSDLMTEDEKGRIREVDELLRGSGYFADADATRAVIIANVTGKLVPAHLDPSVVLANAGNSNPIRSLARVVPITTNVWTGVSSAGITVGWSGVDDQVEVGDDAPTFSNPAVTAHMWDAFVPVTFATYEDWFGGEGEILMMVADGKDLLEAQTFVTGSGTNQPYGIVTALTGGTSQVDNATNNSFTFDDLLEAKNALGRRYRPNAAWVMNEEYQDRIRRFGTAEGSLYTVSLDASSPDRILGRSVYESGGFTATLSAAATNYVSVYGAWENYLIADRVGTISEFIPNLFATGANRPSAQRGWLVHGRTGADSINDGGFVLMANPKTL